MTVADQNDVRRIALSLPGTSESPDSFGFTVEHRGRAKGFVWAWRERVDPRRPKVPRADVIAVRVVSLCEKEALLAAGEPYFTEPHYDGYPAVLVRLPLIGVDELEEVITDAWRCQAPKGLVAAWEAARAG